MAQPSALCRQFTRILGATPSVQNGVCVAARIRRIRARILGRRTRSPLALAAQSSVPKTRPGILPMS